jgi:hypothetical protein
MKRAHLPKRQSTRPLKQKAKNSRQENQCCVSEIPIIGEDTRGSKKGIKVARKNNVIGVVFHINLLIDSQVM